MQGASDEAGGALSGGPAPSVAATVKHVRGPVHSATVSGHAPGADQEEGSSSRNSTSSSVTTPSTIRYERNSTESLCRVDTRT